MLKSEFIVESESPQSIILRDIGQKCRSLTNDIENVVSWLYENNKLDGRRLFYYDSVGELTEAIHDNRGNFVSYACPN